MIWRRLKDFKCPACGANLAEFTRPTYMCSSENCTFEISESKFNKIVGDRFKIKPIFSPVYDEVERNLEALNSL